MRHAEADSGEQLDPTRGLTDLGKQQARMMGKWLDRQTTKPEVVIESNMRRSQQTAKRVAKKLDVDIERAKDGAIDPDSTPEKAIDEIMRIGNARGCDCVIAISHGPLVEEILAFITGGAAHQFHFAHASVAHIDEDMRLHWLVSPNVVARDEDEQDAVTNNTMEAAIAVADAALDLLVEAGEYVYDTVEEKRWVLGDGGKSGENCEPCEENADEGWVDMDGTFTSPDGFVDGPPGHMNCTCSLEYRTRRVRVPV